MEVIFDEACCRRCASHMHKENSWIYRVKVNVLRLQIEVVKKMCKSFSSGETIAHVVGDCLVLTTIRVITHWPQCSAKISFISRKAKHVASIYNVSNKKNKHVKGWQLLIGRWHFIDINILDYHIIYVLDRWIMLCSGSDQIF